jgi:hypothetical protein
MNRKRLAIILTGAAFAAVGLLGMPSSAAAGAVGSCWSIDYTDHEPGGCSQSTTNYSEAGVSVWSSPTQPATLVATGAFGGAFDAFDFQSVATVTTCDNGVQTTIWYFGRDRASHTYGWVPDCYLDGEPN